MTDEPLTDGIGTRGAHLRQSRRQEAAEASGRKLLVTIGIDAYQHLPRLQNAANDARSKQRFISETGRK